jgi:hypothetical protein
MLVGGSAYSLIAASTTPFTLPADVLTGVAIVAMAVLVIVRWPLHTRAAAASARPQDPAELDRAELDRADLDRTAHPYLPWVAVFVVFTAWELFNYLVRGSRANHPTFSSITDANDRFYLLKALLFLAWMAAAWVIVQRGRRK